jgi:hypothetical protein
MNKTAVEWLEEKWRNYDLNLGKSGFNLFLKQAKDMEKQQIIEAFDTGFKKWNDGVENHLKSEDYYNETFKS